MTFEEQMKQITDEDLLIMFQRAKSYCDGWKGHGDGDYECCWEMEVAPLIREMKKRSTFVYDEKEGWKIVK